MDYTIHRLAELSGVSTRTLRYYDGIGLLRPARTAENGYRIYTEREVDRLQQILIYRALGMALDEIGHMLADPAYDRGKALAAHLQELRREKSELEGQIRNVERTIDALKGEKEMKDEEKFEGLKEQAIRENEAAYGTEIRERFGDEAVDASYTKVKGMSKEKWQQAGELQKKIQEKLAAAFAAGDPAGEDAQEACAMHKEWLCMFWKDGTYSREAHRALAEGYVSDPRFTAYYDAIAPGCARFFRDAVRIYTA